jgi:hypothetical protein
MLQDSGREADVPGQALAALRALSAAAAPSGAAAAADAGLVLTPAFVPAMQAVLLGLKAYWKLGRQAEIPGFVAAAAGLAPGLASDFRQLAARVEGELGGCNPGGRARLLSSHLYLSCVDLQFVTGRHHSGSPALEGSADLLEGDGSCAAGL